MKLFCKSHNQEIRHVSIDGLKWKNNNVQCHQSTAVSYGASNSAEEVILPENNPRGGRKHQQLTVKWKINRAILKELL